MLKIMIFAMFFVLDGCADVAVNPSVDGARRPGDLVPQPFPDPKPTTVT